VLVVLVGWCVFWNSLAPGCRAQSCLPTIHRAIAEPEILSLLALHAVTAVAYFFSRKRSAPLRPHVEFIVRGLIVTGMILHSLVAVHLRFLPLLGLIMPWFLPLLAPVATVALYGRELRRAGALVRSMPSAANFRRGRMFVESAVITVALLSGYCGLNKALGWSPFGALTRTCEHTFSALPVPPERGDCFD
jgi:hypothetical protein